MKSRRNTSRTCRGFIRSRRRPGRTTPRRLHDLRLERLELRLALAGDSDAASAAPSASFAPGRVLVKLRQQPVTLAAASSGIDGTGFVASRAALGAMIPASVTSVLSDHGAGSPSKVFPNASPFVAANAAVADGDAPKATSADLARWYSCDVDASTDIEALVAALRADGSVEVAEPDYLFRMTEGEQAPSGLGSTDAGVMALPSTETDPGYSRQWHLNAVKAPEAWAYLESQGLPAGGRSDIVVAVIDTGVDYTHPDLAANMWVNSREIPGNNLDDDGNGFVDDVHGAAVVSDSRSHSGNPMDDNGHGTHVAGIVAASADNDIGGVGVAYNSRIMGLKAFQYSGVGASTDIAEAIYYAVENGADIINMSFGSYSESGLVKDALQVAFGTCVLVAAAGNDAKPIFLARSYPAAYNWVLGVMATDSLGKRATFSNYDTEANDTWEYEILAPGVDVYSTLPRTSYSSWSGTSMATPVVSGIAALLRTRFPDKAVYSSRFIMGQLVAGRGSVSSALAALTDTPRPSLTYLSHAIFDTTSQAAGNDSDGRVDASETIDLAITIRNHWGKADAVTVRLEPLAAGAMSPDPYVTMIIDSVSYDTVGTFNQDDNGLIYDANGIVTGVRNPFRFSVAAATPNDHVIPFRLTISARNGLDPSDTQVYTATSTFTVLVQRGRELPSIISTDMNLTSDDFWIVSGPVLVLKGVTVTVAAGTQMQWGTSRISSPYATPQSPWIQVEGTLRVQGLHNNRVKMFPDEFYREKGDYRASVTILNQGGRVDIDFADIDSPILESINTVSRSTLRGSNGAMRLLKGDNPRGFALSAQSVSESIIDVDGFRPGSTVLTTPFNTTLFQTANYWTGDAWGTSSLVAGTENSVIFGQSVRPGSVLALPTGYTTEGAALTASKFMNNAIVNKLWETNLANWLRPAATYGRGRFGSVAGNYWGTTSTGLLDLLVSDFNDDFNKGTVIYAPVLVSAPETAFPFAWDVSLTAGGVGSVGQVGSEKVLFTVRFNRDMNQAIQPQITFGPAYPFTDYTVTCKSGTGWVDARTWVGEVNVTSLTGDGYQYIRVAGGQAADKPWLVGGNDEGRFRFEIVTSGTEAMNLQASGGEGKVDLMWTQDDFDLLAGYNIYRSTSATGTFSRVNGTVIPKEQLTFTDRTVQPAQTYYYKFRVVKTDGTESVDSNVAAGTPLDTIPPVISHTAVTSGSPNFALTIRADVTDNLAVQGVTLYYRGIGQTTYSSRAMTLTTGSRYSATLDASVMKAPGVEYYIAATDGVSTVYHGLAAQPHRITVVDRPVVTTITPASGPSTGGTSVTIVGSNFKAGASVTIGGAVASGVTIVSATQITATTPAGVPAYADVRVTNSDSGAGTLLGGFRYVAAGVLVSVPTLAADSGGTVEVPISVADVAGLLSGALTLSFDAAVLRPTGGRVGPLATGWSLVTNTATSGQARLTLAGATSVSATGVLAYVSFDVIGAPNASTVLTLSNVSLNDGAIPAQTTAGQVAVNDLHAISGLVRYYADNAPIAGVALFLEGTASLDTTTGATGAYSFADLKAGDYTLMPDKQGDVRQITAYDAALVLQAAAGTRALSTNEATAGDVNRRDGVSALDAAYILQKAVGLIPGTFPNAGTSWVFSPAQRTYTAIAADQVNQHFTGILLGDVSGNWATQSAGPSAAADVGTMSLPHQLTIGSTRALPGDTGVRVPVRIARGDRDVYAADLTITYDVGTLALTSSGVSLGTAAAGMALAVNAATPGVIRVALAGAQPVAVDGDLLSLEFTVVAGATSSGSIAFGSASLNEGAATVATANGAVGLDAGVTVAEGQEATDGTTRSGDARFVKRGGGRLILDRANSHTGGTVVEAGEVVVRNLAALGSGRLTVKSGATVTFDVAADNVPVGAITFEAGGRLDLGYGRITVASGGYSLDAVRQRLAESHAANWSTTGGLTSRMAGNVAGGRLGYVVNDDGSIVVGFATAGDTNLDGVVDIVDIANFAASNKFNSGQSASWGEGDSNYDGAIDVLDIADMVSTSLFNAGTYVPGPSPRAAGTAAVSTLDAAFLSLAGDAATGSTRPSRKRFFATLS